VNIRRIAAAAAAPVAGLALAGLAACSAPSGAQPGGAAPAASKGQAGGATSPYCAKAPSSMVGSALGLPVGKQVISVDGRVSVCAYQGRNEVLVRFQVSEDALQFRQDKKSVKQLHQTVSSVHGLGDQAYFATLGTGKAQSNTLAVRKGTIAIYVTAPKPLSAERSLMNQLLAKV
jgi:hypothetical protein